MSDATIHAIYGEPPRGLVDIPTGTRQCSPLIPGSSRMMDYAPQSLASAIIYAPPGTLERRYVLARMLTALAVGAPLTVLAPKDKGGSRIASDLEAFGCTVQEDSRAHHRIVSTTRPADLHGLDAAIAEGGLQLHPELQLWTHPGVFSWNRIDDGSALLLQHLPNFSGNGADLGCGIGVLSLQLLTSSITQLTLIDIDRRAITAAQKNITDSRTKFVWADIRSGDLPAENLDFIVMNPPFHDTGIEDQTLGQAFITRATEMLKKGGQLWLTANRHLPYEALLAIHFAQVKLVDEAHGFKIYQAVK